MNMTLTVALVSLGYLAVVILARRLLIAVPSRANFEQKRAELAARIEATPTAPALGAACAQLVEESGEFVTGGRLARSRDWLTLDRGRQTAGWRLLHAAERELVATWTPDEISAEATRLGVPQQPVTMATVTSESLVAALKTKHDEQDSEYEQAASVQRRAFFLVVLLAAAIPLVVAMWSMALVVLLGAVGGVLSRAVWMMRDEQPAATDYGLHWSALFLAPAVGAVCAASGLVLIAGMGSLGIAEDKFAAVCEDHGWSTDDCSSLSTTTTTTVAAPASFGEGRPDAAPAVAQARPSGVRSTNGLPAALSPLGSALAFLFGFSEKLFNKWIERAQQAFDPGGATGSNRAGGRAR